MKNIYKIGSFFLLSFVLFTYACEHEQGVGPQGGGLQPTFSSIQTNILTPKCVNQACHPGNFAPMSLRAGAAYGNLVNRPSAFGILRVDPGDADNSALYLKVIGDNSVGARMPLPLSRNALSSAETNAIRDWINNGAQNN